MQEQGVQISTDYKKCDPCVANDVGKWQRDGFQAQRWQRGQQRHNGVPSDRDPATNRDPTDPWSRCHLGALPPPLQGLTSPCNGVAKTES